LVGARSIVADAPWMVALIDQYGYPFCGGTLMSPDHRVDPGHAVALAIWLRCRPSAEHRASGPRSARQGQAPR